MIKVENLSKNYGSFAALKSISFEVRRGEILGFLGPNGAGKSTTMKILTGFFPPTDGSVEVAGLNLDKHLLEIKRKIGYLPENVPLYSDMSVTDFLKFSCRVKGVSCKNFSSEISRVVNECALVKVQNKLICALSKGYKQRVGLAQALVGDPDILILDEPTVGLDPKQIIEIRELIKRMAGSKTVILSTHILPEVSMISDRVIIINEGKIAAIDTPKNLHDRLQSSQDISLLIKGKESDIMALLNSVPNILNVKLKAEQGDCFEFVVSGEKDSDIRPVLAKTIVTSDKSVQLLEIKTVSLSLEDIFLHLVTKEEEVVV